jgi:3-dehydroquinate dehydratase/shikimate dehydrogenase
MALAFSSIVAPRFLPMRLPRVCLALSGDSAEDMLAIAESMARDNPFIEFRLDYLKQPLAALPNIHRFLETHQYVTAIVTCRRADNWMSSPRPTPPVVRFSIWKFRAR